MCIFLSTLAVTIAVYAAWIAHGQQTIEIRYVKVPASELPPLPDFLTNKSEQPKLFLSEVHNDN